MWFLLGSYCLEAEHRFFFQVIFLFVLFSFFNVSIFSAWQAKLEASKGQTNLSKKLLKANLHVNHQLIMIMIIVMIPVTKVY